MSTSLLPAWRNAERAIVEEGQYAFGDMIPFESLYCLLDLPKPPSNARADVMEQWRLRVLQEVTALKREMLTQHNMMLDTEHGVGLRIVMPCEQTAVSESIFRREMTRAMRNHRDRIDNVEQTLLTAEQRRENADARARLAARTDALRNIEHSRIVNLATNNSKQKE